MKNGSRLRPKLKLLSPNGQVGAQTHGNGLVGWRSEPRWLADARGLISSPGTGTTIEVVLPLTLRCNKQTALLRSESNTFFVLVLARNAHK
jgi:hypothetical protein